MIKYQDILVSGGLDASHYEFGNSSGDIMGIQLLEPIEKIIAVLDEILKSKLSSSASEDGVTAGIRPKIK